MATILVMVNAYGPQGLRAPEHYAIVRCHTVEQAVDCALDGEGLDVVDITVECLTLDEDSWVVPGPGTRQ